MTHSVRTPKASRTLPYPGLLDASLFSLHFHCGIDCLSRLLPAIVPVILQPRPALEAEDSAPIGGQRVDFGGVIALDWNWELAGDE